MPDLAPEHVPEEDLDLYEKAARDGGFAERFDADAVIVDLVSALRSARADQAYLLQQRERELEDREGCWVARYADDPAAAVFGEEIEALRYAVDRAMQVKFCHWGDIRGEG